MKKRLQPNQNHPGTSSHTVAARSSQSSLTVNARRAGRRPVRAGQKSKRKRTIQIVAAVIVAFLVVSLVALYLIWRSLTGQIHIEPTNETLPSEFNVPTESLNNPAPVEKGIRNILLLGVDSRDEDSLSERSDSMMILTIDEISGKIKLTSLQRDMLVYVPGRTTPVKINSANAMGGPALAMRVVNDTLRMSITDYMIVNMRGMEQLIDLVGGVTIEVKQSEIEYLNQSVNEENIIYPDTPKSPYVTKEGLQLLNGRQAVAYARIRHLDSDYKRMARQRTVMQAMLSAFIKADLITKGNMISEGLGLITTNISATRLTEIGLKTLPLMNSTIEQLQIPIKGYFTEGYYGSSWCNYCDYNGMIPQLQQFIFGKTYDFDPVKEIPGAPNSSVKQPTSTPTKKPTASATQKPTTAATKPTTETLAPTETTESTAAATDPTGSAAPTTETEKHGKPSDTSATTSPTTAAVTTTTATNS